MRQAVRFIPFILLCAGVRGGSVTISITDNVTLPGTPTPGSLVFSSHSNGSASSSGPTDLSQPLLMTADGTISGSGIEDSGFEFGVGLTGSFTNYLLYPGVSIVLVPAAQASASVLARQLTGGAPIGCPLGLTGGEQMVFAAQLQGSSAASFMLNTTTNVMSLIAGSGESGNISLVASGMGLTDKCVTSTSNQTLIAFAFQNGVVTTSSNTLGLALPSVGSSADFTVSVSPFQVTEPSFVAQSVGNQIDQSASLDLVPEPGTFFVTAGSLGILLLCVRRWKRYTQTNALVSGSRLPPAPGA